MQEQRKSRALSIVSFIFSLAFWIPLLNLIFGTAAAITGIRALIKIRKNPDKYGGKGFAIAGILLGVLPLLLYLTGLGMCLYGYKEICNSIGLQFLAKN